MASTDLHSGKVWSNYHLIVLSFCLLPFSLFYLFYQHSLHYHPPSPLPTLPCCALQTLFISSLQSKTQTQEQQQKDTKDFPPSKTKQALKAIEELPLNKSKWTCYQWKLIKVAMQREREEGKKEECRVGNLLSFWTMLRDLFYRLLFVCAYSAFMLLLLLVLSCCCSQLVVDSLLLLLLLLCLLCACACFHSFVCHCCLPIEVRLCLPGENASRRQRCSAVFIFYCTTNLNALNPLSFSLFAAAAPGQRQPVGWQWTCCHNDHTTWQPQCAATHHTSHYSRARAAATAASSSSCLRLLLCSALLLFTCLCLPLGLAHHTLADHTQGHTQLQLQRHWGQRTTHSNAAHWARPAQSQWGTAPRSVAARCDCDAAAAHDWAGWHFHQCEDDKELSRYAAGADHQDVVPIGARSGEFNSPRVPG